MRVADRGDRDAGGEVEDAPAIVRDEPAALAAIDLEPGVVAEHGREDARGALLKGPECERHHASLRERPVRSACGAAAAGARGAHEAIFGQHLPVDGARASRVAAVLLWFELLAVPVVAVDVARFQAATDFRCFYTAERMVATEEDPYDA